MKKGSFDIKITLKCTHCGQKIVTSDINIFLSIIFDSELPDFECPYCHQTIILEEDEQLREFQKNFVPMCQEFMAKIVPEIKKSGVLEKIAQEEVEKNKE